MDEMAMRQQVLEELMAELKGRMGEDMRARVHGPEAGAPVGEDALGEGVGAEGVPPEVGMEAEAVSVEPVEGAEVEEMPAEGGAGMDIEKLKAMLASMGGAGGR